jgi:hypothetical protein
VEQATAAALLALESRDEAQHVLDEAIRNVAAELLVLTALDVSLERAAGLLDLDTAEVRRLARTGAGRTSVKAVEPQTGRAGTPETDGTGGVRLPSAGLAEPAMALLHAAVSDPAVVDRFHAKGVHVPGPVLSVVDGRGHGKGHGQYF